MAASEAAKRHPLIDIPFMASHLPADRSMLQPETSSKLMQKAVITKLGWYICISFEGEITILKKYCRFGFYEFCGEGVWRNEAGHGVTLEQPDYFDTSDRFIGPVYL